jgi:hypothetical protein
MAMICCAIDRSKRRALLPALFLLCVADSAVAELQSLTVNDPRPVARAVKELEARFGWPITYEDPPYVNASEVLDVTADVRRDPQSRRRVLVPRGGSLSVGYDRPATQGAAPAAESLAIQRAGAAAAVERVVRTDAASRGARMFAVQESNGLLHVVPTRFIDASGHLQQARPLLDTKISVSPTPRSGNELITEICQTLSLATGYTVVGGTIPRKLLARPTEVTAVDEAARSVLSRFLADLPEDLSWQLFYDPGLHWYALNIHVVPGTR